MKISDYIRSIKANGRGPKADFRWSGEPERYPSASQQRILDELESLQQNWGDYDGDWVVVWSKFHGGGILSRHTSAAAAAARVVAEDKTDCMCGCLTAWPVGQLAELRDAERTWHASSPAL